MKIRHGFVTNSSSSSFLLAIKRIPEADAAAVASHPVLKYVYKMLLDVLNMKSEFAVHTVEEYNEFLAEKVWDFENHESPVSALAYEFSDEKRAKALYAKRIKMLEDGFVLYYLSIDYSDESLGDMLGAMADGDNILFTEDYL